MSTETNPEINGGFVVQTESTDDGLVVAMIINVQGAQAVTWMRELMMRACNTWDTAPPDVKELADLVTIGRITQDYRSQK